MEWIKFTEQLPPYDGTEILIAMRNKNMGDAGIWLYDVCCLLVEILPTMITGKVKIIGKYHCIGLISTSQRRAIKEFVV